MTKLINGFSNYSISDDGIVTNIRTGKVKSQWLGANGYYHVDLYNNNKSTKIAVHRILATHFIDNPANKRTVNHIDGDKQNNNLSNLEWATDAENIQHAYDTGLQPYRREFLQETYDSMLQNRFLKGESITSIANTEKNCLTQLSLRLREAAERLGLINDYDKELKRQKNERAKHTGLASRNLITLQMLDVETLEVLHTFSSVTEAKVYLDKKSCGPISNVLAGRQNTAYGYKWKKI